MRCNAAKPRTAVRPHYGLGLTVVEADQLALSDQEKAELAQGLLVIRDKYMQFISRIDGGPRLLSIKLPAELNLMPFYIAAAYLMIAVMIGVVLFFWVRPHWRDLEKLPTLLMADTTNETWEHPRGNGCAHARRLPARNLWQLCRETVNDRERA